MTGDATPQPRIRAGLRARSFLPMRARGGAVGMAMAMLHARTLSIAVLSAAALVAGGCGGDSGGGGGGGGDDESQIRDVITSYASAVADRDGDKACGYLTDAAREQVEKAAKALNRT